MQRYNYIFYFPNKIQTISKNMLLIWIFSWLIGEKPIMRSEDEAPAANNSRRSVRRSDREKR